MTQLEMLNELNMILDDFSVSPLVDDAIKLRYLAEGQDKYCEDTGYFVDNTTFTVDTVASQSQYPLDARIIQVLEVWKGARRLFQFDQLDRPVNLGDQQEREPIYWQTDEQTGSLTLYPTPDAVYTMNLRVWRYPLNSLLVSDPEIPQRLQRACVEWAAFKCLSHHDAELINKVKAKEHLERYALYVEDGKKMFRRRRGNANYLGCDPIYMFQ